MQATELLVSGQFLQHAKRTHDTQSYQHDAHYTESPKQTLGFYNIPSSRFQFSVEHLMLVMSDAVFCSNPGLPTN